MSVKAIRRVNLRQLAKEVGGIARLADQLNKAQSQISHLIGKCPIKRIGDKIAAEVEETFHKRPGWLDRIQQAGWEEEENLALGDAKPEGILCRQVPLIDWKNIHAYLAEKNLPKPAEMIATTATLSLLGFALKIYGDSMEFGSGMSFPEGQVIIVEPTQQAKSGDFVVVQIQPDRGITLKQFIEFEHKKYLKPLNRRYPSLNYIAHNKIWGVVKQLLINL